MHWELAVTERAPSPESTDGPGLVVVFLDNLEDIAVGVAEEETSKRRFSDRLDQRRP